MYFVIISVLCERFLCCKSYNRNLIIVKPRKDEINIGECYYIIIVEVRCFQFGFLNNYYSKERFRFGNLFVFNMFRGLE